MGNQTVNGLIRHINYLLQCEDKNYKAIELLNDSLYKSFQTIEIGEIEFQTKHIFKLIELEDHYLAIEIQNARKELKKLINKDK